MAIDQIKATSFLAFGSDEPVYLLEIPASKPRGKSCNYFNIPNIFSLVLEWISYTQFMSIYILFNHLFAFYYYSIHERSTGSKYLFTFWLCKEMLHEMLENDFFLILS